MRKVAGALLIPIALLVVGCGSSEPEPNTVTNPQKGDGPSKDGAGNQAGASETVDAS